MPRADDGITRRQALRGLGVVGLAAAAGPGIEALVARAEATAPHSRRLKDIEHVVILIQENRSFDHYFGTLSGVRGFADRRGRSAFFQRGTSGRPIHPFHLPTACLPDLTHAWGPQHRSWNHGRMNGFVNAHEVADPPGVGHETMGYYGRSDLRFYYALADAFTICDGYHCSILGPTDPNRLMSMSASIDPEGKHGGPLVETLTAGRAKATGTFTWTTMPERLESHHISWKVYSASPTGVLDSVLPYFKAYRPGSILARRALEPSYPPDFLADIASGQLPQVSWVLPSIFASEHPGYSTAVAGELAARQVVEALVSQPDVWRRTALFITWDENGGFFDHVAPPVAPPGTSGEFLTARSLPTAAEGIRGPLGLGFRVPMLVVSPFSRGGLVCSDTFDHTSTLRFLETRFGVEVPNLSTWRRRMTGDLTAAFNFAVAPRSGAPALPAPSVAASNCTNPQPVGVPTEPFPNQEHGRRRRPSGLR